MSAQSVSHSTVVGAPPARVFAILSDPRQHPEFDGSGTVKAALKAPERLELGSTFGMRMHFLAPYVIKNTVVEYEPDRLIAWRHFGGHRWRYELEPAGEGRTKVTETFDWSTSRSPRVIELMGFHTRNSKSIEATLKQLAKYVDER